MRLVCGGPLTSRHTTPLSLHSHIRCAFGPPGKCGSHRRTSHIHAPAPYYQVRVAPPAWQERTRGGVPSHPRTPTRFSFFFFFLFSSFFSSFFPRPAKYNESEEDVPDLQTLEDITQQPIPNETVLNYELFALKKMGWKITGERFFAHFYNFYKNKLQLE